MSVTSSDYLFKGLTTSDYLLYTQGEQIENISELKELKENKFYQIDNKFRGFLYPTDENVYCLEKIIPNYYNIIYHFNPMREYLFKRREGIYNEVEKESVKSNTGHFTKILTARDLLEDYNIYKVVAEINRGSFLSHVPIVGSTINKGLGYIPGSSFVTDGLNITKNIGTGAANAVIGRGGSFKRKRKTKKNKRKIRKTKRKTNK
jgi:hypothetical protein